MQALYCPQIKHVRQKKSHQRLLHSRNLLLFHKTIIHVATYPVQYEAPLPRNIKALEYNHIAISQPNTTSPVDLCSFDVPCERHKRNLAYTSFKFYRCVFELYKQNVILVLAGRKRCNVLC